MQAPVNSSSRLHQSLVSLAVPNLKEHGFTGLSQSRALLRWGYPKGQRSVATFTVSNTDDSGAGSLRDAVTAANAAGSTSTIAFAVQGTITLASHLPAITQAVAIDATTAPGYTAGGAPQVELDCNGNGGLVSRRWAMPRCGCWARRWSGCVRGWQSRTFHVR